MINPFEFWLTLTCGILFGLTGFFLLRAAKHWILGDNEIAKNYFWGGIGTGIFAYILIYICNMIFP